MQITEVTEISKDKAKIYIDNEFAFVLYKGELRNYHIIKDELIADETYYTIMNEVLPKRAKLRALNLLKSRDYTRYQLENKLKQGFYPQSIIDIAIEYCESYHYIDDERYARAYIEYSKDRKSRKQISQDLQLKGVNKELIEDVFSSLKDENDNSKECELVKKLLEKKKYDSTTTYENRQKIIAYLYRKGFSLDIIYNVMGQND